MSIEKVHALVIEACKHSPASNYTNQVEFEGKTYYYMSETEPHHDYPVTNEKEWVITYHWLKPGFIFVYNYNGIEYNITPELNTPYPFNFKEKHALIKAHHVNKFDDEYYWDSPESIDKELCVIFTLD